MPKMIMYAKHIILLKHKSMDSTNHLIKSYEICLLSN